MSSTMADAAPAGARQVSLRQDAGVIGFVGLAHMVSHFSQLILPPLFPWLKDAFHASYTELGFLYVTLDARLPAELAVSLKVCVLLARAE